MNTTSAPLGVHRASPLQAAGASVAFATALLMISLWTLLLRGAGAGWRETLAGAIPLGALFAAVSVAARFPVRALPVSRTPWPRLLLVHGLGAVTVAALWGLAGSLWVHGLERFGLFSGAAERLQGRLGPILGFATLGYLLAVSVHSLLALAEEAQAAQAHALAALAEARSAELRMLRSQFGPHFLFNTLNTVASLAGREPEAARRACLLLAGILRRTLKSPAPERVALSEELALVHDLLAVEVLRFGARLRVRTEVVSLDPQGVACSPLVLLPLIENAVTHGVAECLEGGEIALSVGREGDAIRLEIVNDCDPDRHRRPGTGLGLDLARRRLVAAFGSEAGLEARDEGSRFRVVLRWPLEALEPSEMVPEHA